MSKKILIASGHLNFKTGINYISTNLMNGLKEKGHEVYYYNASTYDVSLNEFNKDIKVYQNVDVVKLCKNLKIDTLISFEDPWNLLVLLDIKKDLPDIKWIHYFMPETNTLDYARMLYEDGKVTLINLKALFKEMDVIVPANHMARQVLKNWEAEDFKVIPTEYIQPFVPLDSFSINLEARNAVREARKFDENTVLFLSLGDNFYRKNCHDIIAGFAELVNRNQLKDAYLIMHYSLVSPLGWDLMYLARYYNIEDYILFPNNSVKVSDDMINYLYQASDAYVNLSYGEGFGYPIVEAKLTGKPCILPANSIHASYGDFIVEPEGPNFVAQGQSEIYKAYIIEDIYKAFNHMYNSIKNKELDSTKISSDIKLVLDNNNTIIEKWENVL